MPTAKQLAAKATQGYMGGAAVIDCERDIKKGELQTATKTISEIMERCYYLANKTVSSYWLFQDLVCVTLSPSTADDCFGKSAKYWQALRTNLNRKINRPRLELVETIWKSAKENINCDAQIMEYSKRFHNGN
jgi:hypothetical protein